MKLSERCLAEGIDFELKLAGYKKREEQKRQSYDVLADKTATLDEKIKAAEGLMEAWYWRSAEANHPPYWDYVAMLLDQEDRKDNLPKDVYDAMVNKYGKRKGIKSGSYYDPNWKKRR